MLEEVGCIIFGTTAGGFVPTSGTEECTLCMLLFYDFFKKICQSNVGLVQGIAGSEMLYVWVGISFPK